MLEFYINDILKEKIECDIKTIFGDIRNCNTEKILNILNLDSEVKIVINTESGKSTIKNAFIEYNNDKNYILVGEGENG